MSTPSAGPLARSVVFATDLLVPLTDVARAAEDAGFTRVWTTEYPGRDAIARAQHLASGTSEIAVATGIAYAFTRAPLATAAVAADTYTLSEGRFSLGLGAGTRGMRTHFYGVEDFDHPAPRLAEYIALLRATWAAEAGLEFEGRFYRARIPHYRNPHDPADLMGLQVVGSGLNPTMLRHAAASCDRIALHPMAAAEHYLRDVVAPAVAAGATHATRATPDLACWAVVSVADDEKLARRRARQALAFYFATPSYATVSEGAPWRDAVLAIRERFRSDGANWDALADLVPDEMIDELTASGPPDVVAARLSAMEVRFAAHGATEIVLQTVAAGMSENEVLDNCRRIVRDCAPVR